MEMSNLCMQTDKFQMICVRLKMLQKYQLFLDISLKYRSICGYFRGLNFQIFPKRRKFPSRTPNIRGLAPSAPHMGPSNPQNPTLYLRYRWAQCIYTGMAAMDNSINCQEPTCNCVQDKSVNL